ncbi:endonuclease/exonuclease/phosphatase family protein [Maricaulaceae bacterium EIL42A08]|nr:endonuclease/exonuclease/phosphatase family protein [Maricaulaceae bacterium EIL42A08]
MIRSSCVSFGLLLTACSGNTSQVAEPNQGDGLRVAVWNIEHLASGPGLGCEPRDEAGYDLVAEVIDDVDADIWLLQEIEDEEALARVFGADDWTFHVEERPDTGSKPQCWGRDDGNRLRMQRTAIVVRENIQHTRGNDLASLDVGGRGFLRHGVTVTISHNDDEIDLLSVHLKSGCFSGDGSDDCPTLFDQIPIVEDWIDERSEAGRNVIVAGDFNRRLELADDQAWADLNDGDPVGLTIAGDGITPNCDPRYNQFIDFIVMNENAAKMMIEKSFLETTFEEGRRASDHCPISVMLQ